MVDIANQCELEPGRWRRKEEVDQWTVKNLKDGIYCSAIKHKVKWNLKDF